MDTSLILAAVPWIMEMTSPDYWDVAKTVLQHDFFWSHSWQKGICPSQHSWGKDPCHAEWHLNSQDTGCKKYNEHACLPLDNRQIILGHEDVDGNSCIYIKMLDKLLKSWNVSDFLICWKIKLGTFCKAQGGNVYNELVRMRKEVNVHTILCIFL